MQEWTNASLISLIYAEQTAIYHEPILKRRHCIKQLSDVDRKQKNSSLLPYTYLAYAIFIVCSI